MEKRDQVVMLRLTKTELQHLNKIQKELKFPQRTETLRYLIMNYNNKRG